MKKGMKAIALLHLVLLYCFAISIHSGGNLLPYTSSKSQSSNERNYYSLVSPTFLCHTNQTENILEGIQDLSSGLRTNLINDLLSAWNIKEQLQPKRIAHSIHYTKTIDVGLHSTAIIYPFHYFL